nr:hypothetical protein CFP56_11332 [Quercus suber]
MSSDLFAAFSSTEDTSRDVSALKDSQWRSGPVAASQRTDFLGHKGLVVDDDDDFGDFEDASAPTGIHPTQSPGSLGPDVVAASQTVRKKPLPFSSPSPKQDGPQIGRHPFADHMDVLFSADDDNDDYDAGVDEMTDLATNPQAAMEYSKRIIAQQQAEREAREKTQTLLNTRDMAIRSSQSSHQSSLPERKNRVEPARAPKDPNVLFDADNLSDSEDDFGDFEAVETGPAFQTDSATSHISTADLLSLDEVQADLAGNVPGHQDRQLPDSVQSFRQQPRTKDTVLHQPDLDSFSNDAWDDFEESLPTTDRPAIKSQTTFDLASSSAASTSTITKAPVEHDLPPTNIPPPSILLSLFPSLFAQANEALFTPLAKASTSDRLVLMSHPASQKFLSSYLAANVVLGHIIAGRKLRWKRDHYLAQGMRIGPAAGGGKGGMKLAGVDKSEVAKEDREVLDMVRLWKAQLGRLRSALTALNAAKPPGGHAKLPAIPEIAETLPVRVLKASAGGITAPHACALCGLRREERVAKVDVDVDDSFGEWWVGSMSMHLTCKNVWQKHEGLLRSR